MFTQLIRVGRAEGWGKVGETTVSTFSVFFLYLRRERVDKG